MALQRAGITRETPDPRGGSIERDRVTRDPTGIVTGTAVDLVRRIMPPKSFDQRVIEAHVALQRLAGCGGRREREKGSLSVGKLADLTVIDRDLLEIESSAIKDARVLATMVGGRVTYAVPELAGLHARLDGPAPRR